MLPVANGELLLRHWCRGQPASCAQRYCRWYRQPRQGTSERLPLRPGAV